MKKNRIIFFLLFLVIACKPTKNDLVLNAGYRPIQDGKEDSVINQIIAPYKMALDSEMNEVIGISNVAMEKGGELLKFFVADCVLEYARIIYPETDFCLLNNGGLRASIPLGDITVGNIYEVMPFDNEIVVVSLKGDQLLPMFQYIADKHGVPIAGMTIQIGPGFDKEFWKYKEPMIGGKLFDPTKTYKIATSDYLANGGDNMTFWSTGTIETTSIKIRDAIINHIRLQTAQHVKINPGLDGRISATY